MGGKMDPLLKSSLVAGPGGQLQEVRMFSNPAIKSAVEGALATVDPGKRGVILEVDIPETGGVKAVLAARLNEHWSIGLVGAYHGSRKVSGGARVAFEW